MNEDDEPEVELSGEREGAPLDASNVPVIVTVSQVRRGWHGCSYGQRFCETQLWLAAGAVLTERQLWGVRVRQ
jgi:hypothetical protein